MKNNTPTLRSPADWEELLTRYYDGLTTTQEERDLQAYMLQKSRSANPDGAVFAYVSMARHEYQSRRAHKHFYRVAISVAAAAIMMGIAWTQLGVGGENVCEFYIGGKRYTNFDEAQRRMKITLEQVQTEPVSVEQALGNIFNGSDL